MYSYYTIKDIMEATGLSRGSISQKIKSGDIRPSNPEYRFHDGGEYRFSQEEFERIKEEHQKPGKTTGEAAKILGVSITKVHQLIQAGELPFVEKTHGEQIRKYIPEEDLSEYLERNGKKEKSVHFLSAEGYYLFQLFTYKEEKARLMELQEDGTGSLLTETGKILSLAEAKYIGFTPMHPVEDIEYSKKAGWVTFAFHRPKVIDSAVYTIMEWFYRYAGPRNVRVRVELDTIHVQVKPCLLPAITMDNHPDEVQMLKSHVKEGQLLRHSKGIWLKSEYVDVQGTIHRNLKKEMDRLVAQGSYSSIKELIEAALKEKIEREALISSST